MSILLYHYKQLTDCISEVERIETRVNREQLDKIDEERRKGSRTTRFAAIISTTTTVNRILNQAHSAQSLFKDIFASLHYGQ
jgi:hypothetical protein